MVGFVADRADWASFGTGLIGYLLPAGIFQVRNTGKPHWVR
jgi:hypothetical protein